MKEVDKDMECKVSAPADAGLFCLSREAQRREGEATPRQQNTNKNTRWIVVRSRGREAKLFEQQSD